MGTTDDEKDALVGQKAWTPFEECERPAHPVTVSRPFLISKYEITQRQWKTVVGKNPSAFKGDDLPVDSVSWNDVQQFITKLKERSHGPYRLPTEAEWEYCCRAESTNLFGYGAHYEPVSDRNLSCYAWFRADANNRTHAVGEKKPNLWGLYDTEGNLWEWCQDWYAPDFYARSPAKDPLNNQPAVERVFRGGSWFLDWRNLRAAYRSGNLPDFKSQYVGFRLVREIEQKP
jgi:formylglycine-generating enzyme required for sulfatase activity